MFPRLRWGFLEASASWVPYALKTIWRRFRKGDPEAEFNAGFLRANRFFVACETEDDLAPLVERYGGPDWLTIATDYSHGNGSDALHAHQEIADRGKRGELQPAVADRIVRENGRCLYGL